MSRKEVDHLMGEDPKTKPSAAPGSGPGGGAHQGAAGGPASGTRTNGGNGGDTASLAMALEPALNAACGGRLSPITWFRSTWQKGGASTGYARLQRSGEQGRDGAGEVDVVVKLPVGPVEYGWTTGLGGFGGIRPGADEEPARWEGGEVGGPTPWVYAAGTELGGYDLAWLVVERLSGVPLAGSLSEQAINDLLATAVEWYVRAARLRPVGEPPPARDWDGMLGKAREGLKQAHLENGQRWNEGVKHTQRVLGRLVARWAARPINAWCHGDLHPGNAMRRPGGGGGGAGGGGGESSTPRGCVLIDLALVHAGHWVEDAIYLERLYWGKPEMLCGIKPVSAIAKLWRERCLGGGEDYGMLANVRRVLMAACVPAFLAREGNPAYVRAALDLLERLLPIVGK